MRVPALSRGTVDRDAALREDHAALAAAWERARVLVVDAGRALVDGDRVVTVGPEQAPPGDRLYLGGEDGVSYFAVAGPLPAGLPGVAGTLREVGAALADRDAGLLVHAVALANWHAAHPCCPRCGGPTTSTRGGSVRTCTADGSSHFPRTDPAVIVLVHDGGDRCVLGRQAVWPPARYSILAGFVEPGESAEQAVVREVREESGLDVVDVAYAASQPWPFPSSLMLGFTARCTDPAAVPRSADAELEDVRWFSRTELRSAADWSGEGALLLPPPSSVAAWLISAWVAEG